MKSRPFAMAFRPATIFCATVLWLLCSCLYPVPARAIPDGDLTGNGTVEVADALRSLRIAVGLVAPTPQESDAGDVSPLVNGKPAPDGAITVSDALLILRKAVGLFNWDLRPEPSPPFVTGTNPTSGAVGVTRNTVVAAVFNEGLDPASVTPATFSVRDAFNNPVTGTVSFSGITAAFTPSANLNSLAGYTATVSGAVRDLAGNAMGVPFSWSFTTGTTPITPPAQSFTGTYNLTGFTVTLTEGPNVTVITERDVTSFSGTLTVGPSLLTENVTITLLGQTISFNETAPYNLTITGPTTATAVIFFPSGTDTVNIEASGLTIFISSTTVEPDGSVISGVEQWLKVSDLF